MCRPEPSDRLAGPESRQRVSRARQLVKRVLPAPLVEAIRKRRRSGEERRSGRGRRAAARRSGDTDRMIALGTGLWSSDESTDAARFEATLATTPDATDARGHGALALAQWRLHHGEPEAALRTVETSRAASRSVQDDLDLLRVDCLIECGRARDALSALARLTGKHSNDPALTLRAASARLLLEPDRGTGSGPVVEALNTIYRDGSTAMAWRTCVGSPVGVANLSSAAPRAEPNGGSALVTVVTWVDDSGEVPVLESLCDQTWSNIEVLILNGSRAVSGGVLDRSESDDRVRVVDGDPAGRGPFDAAAEHGNGEFVTMQPPSSWAHCQRIEMQAAAMTIDPQLTGTVASHLVVGRDLRPLPLGRVAGKPLIGPAPRLAMFRVAGSTPAEVTRRFEAVSNCTSPTTGELFPPDGVTLVLPGIPLVLTNEHREAG